MTSITYPGIRGHLHVAVSTDPDEKGRVYLEGDPVGLRSLAALLLRLADVDQTALESLPSSGASEHVHLERQAWLSPRSAPELVVGRLDAKHGGLDELYVARRALPVGDIVHQW